MHDETCALSEIRRQMIQSRGPISPNSTSPVMSRHDTLSNACILAQKEVVTWRDVTGHVEFGLYYAEGSVAEIGKHQCHFHTHACGSSRRTMRLYRYFCRGGKLRLSCGRVTFRLRSMRFFRGLRAIFCGFLLFSAVEEGKKDKKVKAKDLYSATRAGIYTAYML